MPYWTKPALLCGMLLFLTMSIIPCAYSQYKSEGLPTPASVSTILPSEQAFVFNLSYQEYTLVAKWEIAPSCYLYQEHLHFFLIHPGEEEKEALIQIKDLPKAEIIEDPYFGSEAVYRYSLTIPVSLKKQLEKNKEENRKTPLSLQINYQGCSASGFCYPPVTLYFAVYTENQHILKIEAQKSPGVVSKTTLATAAPSPSHKNDEVMGLELSSGSLTEKLNHRQIFTAMGMFYLIGILLTFTPCVLPMIPILFGLIVGQKHLNTRKAFRLSLCYVLSMALTYAGAGVIAATLGKNLQARLQQPIYIVPFAILFAYLALAQIGVLRITLPHHFRLKDLLTKLHTKQESGTYLGAAIMGILATLISSPCVTAPLIGALSYISQSGNVLLGGSALLAMGLGMGTILLFIGTLGGKYLPRSGPWMHHVNQMFSIVMFSVSLWLLDRVFHGPWLLALWGGLCLYVAWCMGTFRHRASWTGRVGMLLVVYTVILFWGALRGEKEILKPLMNNPWNSSDRNSTSVASQIQTIHTVAEFATAQELALKQERPLLVVFYADWCTSCQHLEHDVLSKPSISQQLNKWLTVRADVTTYNQNSQDLLRKFELVGPPAVLFFDKNGRELTKFRVIGQSSLREFTHNLDVVHYELQQEIRNE